MHRPLVYVCLQPFILQVGDLECEALWLMALRGCLPLSSWCDVSFLLSWADPCVVSHHVLCTDWCVHRFYHREWPLQVDIFESQHLVHWSDVIESLFFAHSNKTCSKVQNQWILWLEMEAPCLPHMPWLQSLGKSGQRVISLPSSEQDLPC